MKYFLSYRPRSAVFIYFTYADMWEANYFAFSINVVKIEGASICPCRFIQVLTTYLSAAG